MSELRRRSNSYLLGELVLPSIQEYYRLLGQYGDHYPNAIFFASKLIFEKDDWFTRLLHNQAALAIQRRSHFEGLQMVILPMKMVWYRGFLCTCVGSDEIER